MTEVHDAVVRVDVVALDGVGGRQIGPRQRLTELLRDREDEVQAAIAQAVTVVQRSARAAQSVVEGWAVKTVEAKFGLTVAAESGVIITAASAEASFEVTVTIERA